MSKNKFIDCVTFFDNNFMFNLRYNVLKKYIDYFVICESKYDHNNPNYYVIQQKIKFTSIPFNYKIDNDMNSK